MGESSSFGNQALPRSLAADHAAPPPAPRSRVTARGISATVRQFRTSAAIVETPQVPPNDVASAPAGMHQHACKQ